MSDEARITELEIALAHQTHTVEELSSEMATQNQRIERLEKTLKALVQRLLELEDSAAPGAEITKPPHY